MRLALAAVALVVAGAGPGWAMTNDLPRYDVDRKCAVWADAAHPSGDRACIALEQESYDKIKALWSDLPQYVKTYCLAYVQNMESQREVNSVSKGISKQSSFEYFDLWGCVNPAVRDSIPKPMPDHFQP